ncbi:hypothetical protein [Sphingomonas sp. LaA6.9]|uniref:hypothetical protein n=1 Tax=Sphingomonas sp. LaA6.9 TaxID=2919914 RepID=UPI001F4F39F2|nr:hypothetical protein [Sphingomonas sp. LaA6.9]MCJ8159066.1 hypothetical protein [Sphingomonas sp. LaA6.9]
MKRVIDATDKSNIALWGVELRNVRAPAPTAIKNNREENQSVAMTGRRRLQMVQVN